MANIVKTIGKNVTSVGISAAYGDPVSVGGVELLPVALVQFGYGGASSDTVGGGGGGMGSSVPIGAYVNSPRGLVFRPNAIALLAVLIPVLFVGTFTLAGLARVIKVVKR